MTAALKAKRIERLAADSVDQRSRYHAAAYNAAHMNARLGNFARAEALLERSRHETRRWLTPWRSCGTS